MSADADEQLRGAVTARLKSVEASLIAQPEEMTSRVVEWQALAALSDRLHARKPKPRDWRTAALIVASLVCVTLLLLRIPSADITLQLEVTGVRFRVPTRQLISKPVTLQSVGVAGFTSATASPVVMEDVMSTDRLGGRLLVEAWYSGQKIVFPQLNVPPGGYFQIEHGGLPGHWQLAISAAQPVETRLVVSGSPVIHSATARLDRPDLPDSAEITLLAERSSLGKPLDVDVVLPKDASLVLSERLPISSLGLTTNSTLEVGTSSQSRTSSNVLGGLLLFDSLNERERPLRAGDRMEFATIDGVIERLDFGPDVLKVQLHATVTGMTISRGARQVSAMPRVVEWIAAQPLVALLWGAALFVFGMLKAVRFWWKGNPGEAA